MSARSLGQYPKSHMRVVRVIEERVSNSQHSHQPDDTIMSRIAR
jgi:hypothetical protein